jgi:hypothetical protein
VGKSIVKAMYFEDAIILAEEINLQTRDQKMNLLFNNYLKQVFAPQFLKKIERIIKNVTPGEFKDNSAVVAYTKGNKFFINTNQFYSKPRKESIVYLIHEFIHLLENNHLQDLLILEKKLYKLVKQNLKGDISLFLTNKKQDLHSDGIEAESLTYVVANKSANWNYVKEGTKEKYVNLLRESGVFNLSSSYFNYLTKTIEN